MIKIIVEAPRAAGKSYFIRHYLQPLIDKVQKENFTLCINGFQIIERHCDNTETLDELLKKARYDNRAKRTGERSPDDSK